MSELNIQKGDRYDTMTLSGWNPWKVKITVLGAVTFATLFITSIWGGENPKQPVVGTVFTLAWVIGVGFAVCRKNTEEWLLKTQGFEWRSGSKAFTKHLWSDFRGFELCESGIEGRSATGERHYFAKHCDLVTRREVLRELTARKNALPKNLAPERGEKSTERSPLHDTVNDTESVTERKVLPGSVVNFLNTQECADGIDLELSDSDVSMILQGNSRAEIKWMFGLGMTMFVGGILLQFAADAGFHPIPEALLWVVIIVGFAIGFYGQGADGQYTCMRLDSNGWRFYHFKSPNVTVNDQPVPPVTYKWGHPKLASFRAEGANVLATDLEGKETVVASCKDSDLQSEAIQFLNSLLKVYKRTGQGAAPSLSN